MATLTLATSVRGKLQEQANLSQFTSWRVGGAADYLYIPADLADLAAFLQQVPASMPITWLGLGSNTLIRDRGIRGLVIITQGALNQLTLINDKHIRAEAGVSCAQLARFSARLGLTGLEFMAGIPGTVGGALVMNAGCFGGETWRYVIGTESIDRAGKLHQRSLMDYTVSYRQVQGPSGEWFVAGRFELSPGNKEKSLSDIKALLEKRNQTQPTSLANCGSTFRNPPGNYAGKLIEECGLKGKQIGGALVSTKHANFIINENHATAKDIEQLIEEVQKTVEEKTGIKLHREVHILGEE